MHPRGTERLVVAIGEISASSRTVLTPSGSAAVNDASWTISEASRPRGRGWYRTLFGAAATDTVHLTVTVTGPGWQHVERVGPATREDVTAIRAKVTQARMLALRAVVWSLESTPPLTTTRVPPEPVEPGR